MNKTFIALLITCLSFTSFAQSFFCTLNSKNHFIEKATLITNTSNGKKEETQLSSKLTSRIELQAELFSNIESIEVVINNDTLLVMMESSMFKLGLQKKSEFSDLQNDTINIFFDVFPYEKKYSKKISLELGVNEFPDSSEVKIMLINDSISYSVIPPAFNLEAHSKFYSSKIQNEVCECMSDKTKTEETFNTDFSGRFEETLYKIVPEIDNSLKARGGINTEPTITNLVHAIATEVNQYVIENCLE